MSDYGGTMNLSGEAYGLYLKIYDRRDRYKLYRHPKAERIFNHAWTRYQRRVSKGL